MTAAGFALITAVFLAMPVLGHSNSGPDVQAQSADHETPKCPCNGDNNVNGGYYSVGGAVSAPRLISTTKPEYTEEARKAKIRGSVVLHVFVGRDGCVSAVRVARALGVGLDEQAVNTVRCWRYQPAMKDGRPVQVKVVVSIDFEPNDSSR